MGLASTRCVKCGLIQSARPTCKSCGAVLKLWKYKKRDVTDNLTASGIEHEMDLDQLKKVLRTIDIIAGIIILLFLPLCILVDHLFPSKAVPFALGYFVLVIICGLIGSSNDCPRCGSYFNVEINSSGRCPQCGRNVNSSHTPTDSDW